MRSPETVDEVLLLPAHIYAGRVAEIAVRAQEIAAQSDDWNLVLQAAQVLSVWANETPAEAATAIHRQVIAAARRGLALAGDTLDEQLKFLRIAANLILALSCKEIGDNNAALQACEDALRIDPNDFNALMLFGWLNYSGSPTTDPNIFRDCMRRNLIPSRLDAHVAIGKA